MTALQDVLAALDRTSGWQEDFYRDLHAHPELSHQEHATAEKVAARLAQSGYEVHRGVGGTGVVGVLSNGSGLTVLARADIDALPVKEATGLPYASTDTGVDENGKEVPVMHACGHDVHVAALLGATDALASSRGAWGGTLIALFQPGEETADGADAMLKAGLVDLIPHPDVAFAQHVLPLPAGKVGTRTGAVLSAGDSVRITIHGRGSHGSMPQNSVDPVVLAALIVLRLQTIISRETAPGEFAVLTVGSSTSGTKSNVIPDEAVLLLNVRTYDESVRRRVLASIQRMVRAECQASGALQEPEFASYEQYPLTENDPTVTTKVTAAFGAHFADNAIQLSQQTASEDFSALPKAFGVPYTYWGLGGIDPETYRKAAQAGRIAEDIPVNHSASFAPVIQPTLRTGSEAMVVATLAYLGRA